MMAVNCQNIQEWVNIIHMYLGMQIVYFIRWIPMVICKYVCKLDFLYILQYEIVNFLHVAF